MGIGLGSFDQSSIPVLEMHRTILSSFALKSNQPKVSAQTLRFP
jgi:hypothetical protein